MFDDKKCCANCKYFYKHYINIDGRFLKTAKGHCVNINHSYMNSDKALIEFHFCKYWERGEMQKQERHESIENTLRNIAASLDDIAKALKLDL